MSCPGRTPNIHAEVATVRSRLRQCGHGGRTEEAVIVELVRAPRTTGQKAVCHDDHATDRKVQLGKRLEPRDRIERLHLYSVRSAECARVCDRHASLPLDHAVELTTHVQVSVHEL